MKIKPLFDDCEEEINISTILTKYGVDDVDEYLKPTGKYIEQPCLYINMKEGVQAFKYHYLQNDKAYILSDSGDSDGILSTTIIYRYMKLMNPKWNIKILIHDGKQRGLDDKKLFAKCVNEPRPLLIIPDSGTNDYEQTKKLTELGTTVIVLDHHNPTTPIVDGILINNQIGDVDKHGSGAMVTHHFCRALDIEFGTKYAKNFIDLASLSIMSDGCDIRSMQNRTYMYYGIMGGLKRINNKFLKLMMTELIKDDYIQKDINFTLVPKINATCRGDNQTLKQDMICAFCGIYDKEDVRLLDILSQMRTAHTNQQNAVKKFIKDNFEDIDKSNDIIIHISDKVPRTFSGLVAGRIKDMCDNKPTIISYDFKSSDTSIGSLRSDIPLQSILNDCEYVDWCKGHDCQAGVQFKKENINDIIQYINSLGIDYEGFKTVISSMMVKHIPTNLFSLLEPYKQLFDTNKIINKYHIQPFTIYNTDIRTLGKGNTIKFTSNGLDFLMFFTSNEMKERLYMNSKDKVKLRIECLVELGINEYMGRKTPQAIIQEFECVKVDEELLDFDSIWGLTD